MNTEINSYETTRNSWREEFEKSYVEWVDLELISALLESMDCSIRFFCEAINDTTRWPSKINRSLKTVSYPRIRDAADFLGIPPWLLFNHNEKNSKIKELFENINSALKPIELPYFSEYRNDYYDFHEDLFNRSNSEHDYQVFVSKLNKLYSQKNYDEGISGNWKAVSNFFKGFHRDSSGGAIFLYRDPEGVFRGNMRLNFASNPRAIKSIIKAGWVSIETEHSGIKYKASLLDKFVTTVISDMETIFDQNPWDINFDSPSKQTKLLIWNTLRKNDKNLDKVSSLINRKLPDANFSVNISDKQHQSQFGSALIKENPFEEFIEIIKEDVPITNRFQTTRRANTLRILYDRGVIQDGDQIKFIPRNSGVNFSESDRRNFATLITDNKKNFVTWHYDNKNYSISQIAKIIIIEFGQNPNLHKHHLNGNFYWSLINDQRSLYSMALKYSSPGIINS